MIQPAPPADPAAAPWWKGAVIYQIYPRSFADSNGDGIGDLPGITARLDHVASLGVDAIWLSPFFASPMKDYGYDVADYRAVDPMFGTLDDFDRLVARAHDLGLRVVIDQVYSHTSDEHAWFRESRADRTNPRADWYVWADPKPDGTPPNNWLSVFYGPSWTWDARRGQYYLHNFLPSQPDLNVHDPAVQAALIDTARFWLDRGVDGFRLDAINFAMHDRTLADNPPVAAGEGPRARPFDFQHHYHNQSQPEMPAFLERLGAVIRGYPGDRFTVAEVGGEQAAREMKAFTAGGTRLDTAYGFEFLYSGTLTAEKVFESLAIWPGARHEGWPSWAFSNHDAPRVATRWGGDGDTEAWARLALVLLMALRGNIFLYQGEELGLPQAEIPFAQLRDPEAIANWPLTQGRDGARTPMSWAGDLPHGGFSQAEPWLPVPDAHLPLAVAAQEADAGSVLHLCRRLIALRRGSAVLREGAFAPVAAPAPVIIFDRVLGNGRIRCLFNPGDDAVTASLPAGELLLAVGDVAAGRLGPLAACLIALTDEPTYEKDA